MSHSSYIKDIMLLEGITAILFSKQIVAKWPRGAGKDSQTSAPGSLPLDSLYLFVLGGRGWVDLTVTGATLYSKEII